MVDLVEIRMRLSGGKQVASEAKTANKAIEGTGTAAKRASAQASAGLGAIGATLKRQGAAMRSVGRTATTHLTLPIIGLGYYAVKTAASFERSMKQVQVAGGLGGKGLKEMEDLALEMGAKTIFSANDAAEAMLELVKTGITPAQIQAGALASTMSLAATEGLELGRTAEIIGATMNTFGLEADETRRIADALAGGALASSASVSGLAQSLAQGGQGAAEMGLSVEETVGALAAFAQNGIQASDAGTSLKTFLSRLVPYTKKASDEMDRLGLNFFNSKGEMKTMGQIAANLKGRLADLSDKERSHALAVIFGSDARRAANILYKEGAIGLGKYTDATKKEGAAQKMAQAQMQGLPGAIERLKGSLETAALVAGKAMAPAIELVAGKIEWLANKFTDLPPEIQTFIVVGLVAVAMLGPLIYILGALATAIGAVATALAFLTGPVGLIALAVIAAGIGFAYLYTHVEWFHDAVDSVVSFVKSNWRWLGPLLMAPFLPFAAVVVLVITHLGWLKNAFNNVVAFFRRLPGRVLAGLKALPRLIGQLVAKMIVLWATLPFKMARLAVQIGIRLVGAIIQWGPKILVAALHAGLKILGGLKAGWEAVHGWVMSLPGQLASWVASLAGQFLSIGAKIAGEIAKGFYDALPEPIKGAVGTGAEIASGGAEILGDVGSAVNPFDGNARGTEYWRGGVTLVGEEGPELVNLPRAAKIHPAQRTQRILEGGWNGAEPPRLEGFEGTGANGEPVRMAVPLVFKIGKRKLLEAVAEAQEDVEARA